MRIRAFVPLEVRIAAAGLRTGIARTEAERICVSFRDQSADWSWESVIPLHKGQGGTDCHTGDIGHCHRNDRL